MSDDVDDLHHAEDMLGLFHSKVTELGQHWQHVYSDVAAISGALIDQEGPNPALAALMRLPHDLTAVRALQEELERIVPNYCRPTCGHLDWLENDGEEGADMGDVVIFDCDDDTCGCMCHRHEEWDEELGRWRVKA